MRRKGFTLVELLAVIAIIGVLSIVTVPIVMTVIGNANKSSFTVGVQSLIDATKLYISSKDEIIEPQEIPIEELKEELKNYNYVSGIVIVDENYNISVVGISDGNYCANGTKNDLTVIKGDCSALDTTPPEVDVVLNEKTSNSLTILVNASDSTSGIYGYSYSTDGANYSEINNENIYTISNLDKGQTQKIYVRVYNDVYDRTNSEQNLSYSMTEKEVEFTTLSIDKPRFEVSSSDNLSKIVDIIYPKDEGGYIYTYEFNGVEHTSDEDTIRLTINENGVLIARVQAEGEIVENELRIVISDNDSTTPSVEAKTSTVNLKFEEDYVLTDLFNISNFDSSSDSIVCYSITNDQRNKTVTNNSELSLGVNVIECEATKVDGTSAQARVTIKHSYTANTTCSSGTYQNGTCYFESNASVCGTEEKEVTVQEYSTCATTVNTCKYGCDSVWNANINCTTETDYNNCVQLSCVLYKSCDVTSLVGSYDDDTGTMPSCPGDCDYCEQNMLKLYCVKYKQHSSCGSETVYDNTRCAGKASATCTQYGTKQVCAGGYEQKNCSSCKTGSANTCQAGYVDKVTTETVALSCDKPEYIEYTCSTSGINTSTNQTINATLQGNNCQF